jgi:type 1 glutamine amidotransferase
MEEWYTHKNFAKDLHVILVMQTKGMKGPEYDRPPFPAAWARMHGKGRVFYTCFAHREDVWTNPVVQAHILGGLGWTMRNVNVDVTPNINKVTPEASILKSPA